MSVQHDSFLLNDRLSMTKPEVRDLYIYAMEKLKDFKSAIIFPEDFLTLKDVWCVEPVLKSGSKVTITVYKRNLNTIKHGIIGNKEIPKIITSYGRQYKTYDIELETLKTNKAIIDHEFLHSTVGLPDRKGKLVFPLIAFVHNYRTQAYDHVVSYIPCEKSLGNYRNFNKPGYNAIFSDYEDAALYTSKVLMKIKE